MESIKCQEKVDNGASRVRGFHNTSDCKYKAKCKVIYPNGHVEYLCGVHKRAVLEKGYNVVVEELA